LSASGAGITRINEVMNHADNWNTAHCGYKTGKTLATTLISERKLIQRLYDLIGATKTINLFDPNNQRSFAPNLSAFSMLDQAAG